MNSRARKDAARTAPWLEPRVWLALAVLALGAGAALRPAHAQDAQPAVEIATADELYDIVGPIALYPDDLVAIVLPAATYPLQIVQAARFLEDRRDDSSRQPDEEWDDSIVALLNYPEVVELLNDDLDWTYDLGTAVLNQRADVLNAIQTFRDEAYAAGNLRTDERQTVARDDGAISIKPASPQVIYVPYYEPEQVVIYQRVPVYHYYPRRYPVYYYPYPAHYVFDTGYFWGVRSWFSIGWRSHHVHVYDWHYHSHPYFGWSYYDPWYPRNVFVNINVNRNRDYIWEPRNRYGGRPVVRGNEGRVYAGNTPPVRTGGGMAGGAYRSRSVEGRTQQGGQAGEARQPRRGVLADPNSGTTNRATTTARSESGVARGTAPQRSATSVYRNRSSATQPLTRAPTSRAPAAATRNPSPTAAPERVYRSGGGMSQARERAQPQIERVAPPRATQPSTGMPRESSRGFEMRESPPARAEAPSRAPSGGGMSQAQRGGDGGGGSYRGGGNSDGGGARSGHPAARGEGRSGSR
jgi:hypothetical protein